MRSRRPESLLFGKIHEVVNERALGVPKSHMRIVPSELGTKACIMGTMALVVQERLESPKAFAFASEASPQIDKLAKNEASL